MTTPIDPDRALAQSDLNDIIALRSNKPFNRYWTREAQREISKLESSLTTDDLPNEKTIKKRAALAVWRRVADKLDQDEIGNRLILGLEQSEKVIECPPGTTQQAED